MPRAPHEAYLPVMTIRVNEWYRVKSTDQFCVVQRIPSTTSPGVSVQKADENTRGFEVALVWYAPADGKAGSWTKRVIVMDARKATALLREPGEDGQRIVAEIRKNALGAPVSSASRDGEFTMPV